MKYSMTVFIEDPNTESGKSSELMFLMTAEFAHDPDTYGNGYTGVITNDTDHYQNVYDLRYDKDFNINRAISWLASWADNYWNGKNGAYRLKSINISRKGE